MSNGHMSVVLYEARCMASSCSFFQWLLLGHLRVRCRSMSDMSFMSGVRRAVSKSILQVCYHSQTFRFIPCEKQENDYHNWPALLITVHNLSLETQASFIQRCIARSNLKPLVRSIQMGKELYGRDQIIRQYFDVFFWWTGNHSNVCEGFFGVGSRKTISCISHRHSSPEVSIRFPSAKLFWFKLYS